METSRKSQKLMTTPIFIFLVIGYMIPFSECDYITSENNLAYQQAAVCKGNNLLYLTDGNMATCDSVIPDPILIALPGTAPIKTVIVQFRDTAVDASVRIYDVADDKNRDYCDDPSITGLTLSVDCNSLYEGVNVKFQEDTEVCDIVVSKESVPDAMQNMHATAIQTTSAIPTTTAAPTTPIPTARPSTKAAPPPTTSTARASTEATPTTKKPTTTDGQNTGREELQSTASHAPRPTTAPGGNVRSAKYQRDAVNYLDSNAPFTTVIGGCVEECATQCLDKPCKAFKWMSQMLECLLYENVVLVNSPGIIDFFQVLE